MYHVVLNSLARMDFLLNLSRKEVNTQVVQPYRDRAPIRVMGRGYDVAGGKARITIFEGDRVPADQIRAGIVSPQFLNERFRLVTARFIPTEAAVSSREAPTFALITALPKEFAAMRELLDEPWEEVQGGQGAGRRFTRGTIPARGGGRHYVVLAVLPDMGNNLAAVVATRLQAWYPTVRHLIVVGVAGGIPHAARPSEHVRLGDVVVSDRYGVVQYDLVKDTGSDLQHRAPPRAPSAELVEAVRHLQADEAMGGHPWLEPLEKLAAKGFRRPDEATDVLGSTEDPSVIVTHPDDPDRRPGEPRVFYGPVASADVLLKNAVRRDALRAQFGVRAVEMEGSGVADATWVSGTGYLVVRGICDYCDANKKDAWQAYAAAVAAGYVRTLLESMPRDPPLAIPGRLE